jgi:hypothetical protein
MTHSGKGAKTTTILPVFNEEVRIVKKLSYSNNLFRLNPSTLVSPNPPGAKSPSQPRSLPKII